MREIRWEQYPSGVSTPYACAWLQIQADLQLASNTVAAYGRNLNAYLAFCQQAAIDPTTATRADIAAYVRHLVQCPSRHGPALRRLDSGAGLANATLQQHITVLRLFYDYLCEEGCRADNPVGRGRYTPGKGFAGARDRALVPRFRTLPWIPTDDQWCALLDVTRLEPLRTRVMFALAYDAGLRREELCALETDDFRPGQRLVRIRAETTKNHLERWVPYSTTTAELYRSYLYHRRTLSSVRGPLFLSESRRNRAAPISIWTWSKVITKIAQRAQVPQFTPHTLRHLCLTDRARADWDIHEIARFAGHRSTQTTRLYIPLSGRDLAAAFARSMRSIHARRTAQLAEVFQ